MPSHPAVRFITTPSIRPQGDRHDSSLRKQCCSFGQAGTLVQFSRIYKDVADKRGIKILRALAMDGGAGAQIHIPKIKKSFGDTGLSYFPNAIRFDAKLEQSITK